jgi:hypothetical protein
VFDIKVLETLCKHVPHTMPLIQTIHNVTGWSDTALLNACTYGENITEVFKLSGAQVTKEHCEAIIKSKYYIIFPYVFSQYMKSYSSTNNINKDTGFTVNTDGTEIHNKIDELVKLGYVVTKDDFLFSIKNNVSIPIKDEYKHFFDQEVLDICHESDNYPDYPFSCIKPEMYQLLQLCGKRNKKSIIAHMKKYKLVPNKYCVEAICRGKDNHILSILQIFIDAGAVVTLEALKNNIKYNNRSTVLAMMIDNIILNSNKTNQVYNISEASDASEQISELSDKSDKSDKSEVSEKSDKSDKSEQIIKQEVFINYTKIILEDYLDKLPKKKNIKQPTPELYKQLFKDIPNTTTYIALRKHFYSKIKKLNMTHKEDNTMIVLTDDICNILKLDKNSMINVSDVDMLLAYFY